MFSVGNVNNALMRPRATVFGNGSNGQKSNGGSDQPKGGVIKGGTGTKP